MTIKSLNNWRLGCYNGVHTLPEGTDVHVVGQANGIAIIAFTGESSLMEQNIRVTAYPAGCFLTDQHTSDLKLLTDMVCILNPEEADIGLKTAQELAYSKVVCNIVRGVLKHGNEFGMLFREVQYSKAFTDVEPFIHWAMFLNDIKKLPPIVALPFFQSLVHLGIFIDPQNTEIPNLSMDQLIQKWKERLVDPRQTHELKSTLHLQLDLLLRLLSGVLSAEIEEWTLAVFGEWLECFKRTMPSLVWTTTPPTQHINNYLNDNIEAISFALGLRNDSEREPVNDEKMMILLRKCKAFKDQPINTQTIQKMFITLRRSIPVCLHEQLPPRTLRVSMFDTVNFRAAYQYVVNESPSLSTYDNVTRLFICWSLHYSVNNNLGALQQFARSEEGVHLLRESKNMTNQNSDAAQLTLSQYTIMALEQLSQADDKKPTTANTYGLYDQIINQAILQSVTALRQNPKLLQLRCLLDPEQLDKGELLQHPGVLVEENVRLRKENARFRNENARLRNDNSELVEAENGYREAMNDITLGHVDLGARILSSSQKLLGQPQAPWQQGR